MTHMANISSESVTRFELPENSSLEILIQTQVDLSGISDEAILTFTLTVYGVLCQTISVFGIVTNVINIICFLKQDLKDSINISLVGKETIHSACYIENS